MHFSDKFMGIIWCYCIIFMLSEHYFVVKLPKSEYCHSLWKAVILHPKT